jgi:hypothetical protein|tara:strand:- start:4545 stop:4937 length:393 start_codon:yes stop_codon:yes gene_type:complete
MKRRVMTEKEKVANRVYKTEEYLEILKDVMEDITIQTNFMNDKELNYDRNLFVRNIRDIDIVKDGEKDGYLDYNTDVHTISILVTQLLRYGEILYQEKVSDDVDEQNGHKIDDDFFDEREFESDEEKRTK